MPTMAESPRPAQSHFDPDEFRMTVGEHLEELRRRMIRGLTGFALATVVCLIFGTTITTFLCRPLVNELLRVHLTPQVQSADPSDVFMVYIQVSLVFAGCVAAPWMLYQLWQFVAAGLYPTERQYITRYVPLSIGLLLTGMVFVYTVVLPLTLRFFIAFALAFPIDIGLPTLRSAVTSTAPSTRSSDVASAIAATDQDPANPAIGQIWYNAREQRLKIFVGDNTVRVIPFGGSNLIGQQQYMLPEYISLVIRLLLTFGLAFQLPLVVMAVAKVGIVDVPALKRFRRYVYFGMALLAAALTPGDVVTAMLALLFPLIFLYELGIILAARSARATAME
jgi:Sec-independent protein secretion pathway component TatC